MNNKHDSRLAGLTRRLIYPTLSLLMLDTARADITVEIQCLQDHVFERPAQETIRCVRDSHLNHPETDEGGQVVESMLERDMTRILAALETGKVTESEARDILARLPRTITPVLEERVELLEAQAQAQRQSAERDRQVGLCVSAMLLRPTMSGSSEAWSNAALCRLDPQAALKIPPPSPTPPPSLPAGDGAVSGPAFYRGEQRSGFNKICLYDRLGSAVAVTVGAMEMCPRVVQ